MSEQEKEILRRWVERGEIQGEHVYDVHLDGPDPEWPAHYTAKEREEWRWLTAKRVDLVIRARDRHWLVEVTPRLSTRALGALLLYSELYGPHVAYAGPVSLACVVEVTDAALLPLFEQRGIRVWVV